MDAAVPMLIFTMTMRAGCSAMLCLCRSVCGVSFFANVHFSQP